MTVAEFLEEDPNYFSYVKSSFNKKVEYFERNFIFGDSATARLSFIEKSEVSNINEALVNLIIPKKLEDGIFRCTKEDTLESKFEIIKEDLKFDIYWNTIFIDCPLTEFISELNLFENKEINDLDFYTISESIEEEQPNLKLERVLNECKTSVNKLKGTKWNPSLEYLAETKNYFVLYEYSTGA